MLLPSALPSTTSTHCDSSPNQALKQPAWPGLLNIVHKLSLSLSAFPKQKLISMEFPSTGSQTWRGHTPYLRELSQGTLLEAAGQWSSERSPSFWAIERCLHMASSLLHAPVSTPTFYSWDIIYFFLSFWSMLLPRLRLGRSEILFRQFLKYPVIYELNHPEVDLESMQRHTNPSFPALLHTVMTLPSLFFFSFFEGQS